jgi:hypothetical protein
VASGLSSLAAGCSLLVPLDGSVGDASTPSDDAPSMMVGDAVGDASDAMAELGAPLKPCVVGGGATGLCAPYPPDGWAGPLIFYEGPAADPVQACASGYAPSCSGCTLHASPSSDPATCATCSCDPSNVVCGIWLTDACESMSPEGGVPYPSSGCYGPIKPDQSFGYPAPVGTCNASGGGATIGPPWGQTVTACSPTATLQTGNCAPGEWCLATPPPPFPARFCVSQPGTLACPGGTYVVPFSTFQDASDTRACTKCSCGSPQNGNGMKGQGLQCSGEIQICEDDACSECTPAECQNPGWKYVAVDIDPTPFEAGCEPEGGEATGQLEPTGPITFCCSQ